MKTETAAKTNKGGRCRLHCRRIGACADLPAVSEVFSRLESASILGGNAARADAGRFSYWAAEPREIFEFRAGRKSPFEKLHKALSKYRLEDSRRDRTEPLPHGMFCGGWIGYFSYELGRYIEKLPESTVDDIAAPLIRLCFYDRFIAYDHIEKDFRLIALQLPGDIERTETKLDALQGLLAESAKLRVPRPVPADFENIDFSQIRSNMDEDYYPVSYTHLTLPTN